MKDDGFVVQLDAEAGFEAVLPSPMLLQCRLEGLVCQCEPKEGHTPAGDQVLSLPMFPQQLTNDGEEASLDAD